MLKKTILTTCSATLCMGLAMSSVQAGDTIKIGSFLAVTGPASFLGDPELKTLELYIGKINASGGVLGKQLELVHFDTGASPKKARTFAKRLIEVDQVDIIIGGSTTGSTMAVVPLVEAAGIPFISLAGGVPIVEPIKKWVFKTPRTDRMAARKIFEDMKKRGITKIGLISGSGGFGKSGRKQSMSVAEEYGITIVSDETYGKKDTDMTAQLTKMKNTDGIEAILCFGFGQGPAIVTKNARQLGITLPLYQTHGVASQKFLDLAGASANGVRLTGSALLVSDKLADNDPQKGIVQSYVADFAKAFNKPASTFGGYAYDALGIAVSAYKTAGTTDKAKVRDAIEATKGLVGTVGIFNMSAENHVGITKDAFRMLEVKDGKWTIIE